MINGEIKEREIRLIGSDGSQLGIISTAEAQKMADEKSLDLVNIAPKAKPPVCKLMNYGKYKFEMAKREKEAKKKQHVVNIKEVRITPSIDDHDFQTKVNQALKFLQKGNKVKVAVRFRGREVNHASLGKELLNKFADAVDEVGLVEKSPTLEGRNMIMFLASKVK